MEKSGTSLRHILAAHGGLEYWRSLQSLEVEMSASGLLFTSKRIPPPRHLRLTVSTERPEVTLHDYPAPGQVALFQGEGFVQVQDANGKVLQARTHPRAMFGRLHRQLYWDTLDFAFFCGYAMWNYLTMPFLFLQDGVEVEVSSDPAFEGLTRITAHFPKGFSTHCATQHFYFDDYGHLQRHDYTAEVVGGWASAAHLCSEYRQFGGLSLPTQRRVYPKLLLNKPLSMITLVAIDIHDVKPVMR